MTIAQSVHADADKRRLDRGLPRVSDQYDGQPAELCSTKGRDVSVTTLDAQSMSFSNLVHLGVRDKMQEIREAQFCRWDAKG